MGERLIELVQRQEKINAQMDEMLKAITAIKDRLQGSGGATGMVDIESNRQSLVEEDDPIVQLRSLKQVSHVRSYIEAFATLNSKAGIQEDQALSLFLSGLVDEIRVPVCLFKPKTLDEAYALSKLQELIITGVFWCDRKERHEDEVDYSTKDSIRNSALETEWKLDSEMEDGTYANEEIDLDAEIDVFEEEEADWDDYIEKETGVTTAEVTFDTVIQIDMDQSAAYVEAATEVLMESSLDSAHLEPLQNTQIQIDMDQSSPDPQIEETEVKAAMEMEVADMKKVDKDFGLAGLMQSEGGKEMGEALRRFGNWSSDCPMIVKVWQVSVWDGEVKMKHMVVPIDSCRVFKGGGGMTRVAYRQVLHGEVICGKLGKQIDLDVESAAMWQLKIFQYRDENLNKTIVHFVQRFGRFFTSSVYGQFGSPQVRDMLNCFDVRRLLMVMGGLITDEGVGAFGFVDDRKEQGLSLEFISSNCEIMLTNPIVITSGQVYDDSNNKQWLDGSCKECPVAEVEDVVVAATDEKTAGNGTIQWLYWFPMSTVKMKFLQIVANRVFDGGGMDGPFICMLHMGIFCYMILHTLSVACMSSLSCNAATWHRQALWWNSRTRSTLNFHCSLRTRNFMGGVLTATKWKMQRESCEESMAVEGEPIMYVKYALAVYEEELGNSRNFPLYFGVDSRAGERLDHGKVNGTELKQYIVAFSDYRTCSQANEFKETELLANARQNAQSRELPAILSVIRNSKGFSVRFPKPMVKMKFVLFSFWEMLRETNMLGVLRRKVVCQGSHAWGLEQGLQVIASKALSSSTKETMTVRDALNSTLDEEISADSKVLVMGEEVGEYQGAYKITKGLLDKYGLGRVADTTITMAGFVGIRVGAAYYSPRPLIELMTFNFSMQTIDHLSYSAAKSNYMFPGKYFIGQMVLLLVRLSMRTWLCDSSRTRNLKGDGLLRSQIEEEEHHIRVGWD